jgi:hypothetical protein
MTTCEAGIISSCHNNQNQSYWDAQAGTCFMLGTYLTLGRAYQVDICKEERLAVGIEVRHGWD